MKTREKIKDYKGREHDEYVLWLINRLRVLSTTIKEEDMLLFSSEEWHNQNEFLKFVPVAIVSCFEEFFRKIIAEYIDSDNSYFNRAKDLIKDSKAQYDFELIHDISEKEFTIGEFVSFSLPYSQFKTIKSNFEFLIDRNLVAAVENISTNELYDKRTVDEELVYIKENIIEILKSISKIYHHRNVICHEFGAKLRFTKSEAEEMLVSSIQLLQGIERVVIDDLYKGYPWTNSEIIKQNSDRLDALKVEYCILMEKLTLEDPDRAGEITEVYSAWEECVDNSAILYSRIHAEGGNLQLIFYYESIIKQYEDKIVELKSYFYE